MNIHQTIVETAYGKISGVPMDGVIRYAGIPYAKPPVGDLRFRRPEKPDAFQSVYAADRFRGTAMQPRNHTLEFETDYELSPPCSEDCLYLNIWVPEEKGEEKLPVAFWIHGGGFFDGSGGEKCFDGTAFAKRGVILVTLNYRLNVFGFLAHPWLSARDPLGISGNYGLYDQEAALRWVYENISAFGGDPGRITIFGQSAGCMSVQSLISSDRNRDAIHQAILESGFSFRTPVARQRTLESACEIGEQLLTFMGVKDVTELLEMPAEKLLSEFLRFRAENAASGIRLPFSPITDGVILSESSDEAVERGHVLDIPLMMGCTEGDMGSFGEDGKLLPLHERRLAKGMLAFAEIRKELGQKAPYLFCFSHHLPGDDNPGAPHSAELWYVFGTLGRSWRPMTEEDEELSGKMVSWWTNFMKTGDPNREDGEVWKPAGEEPFVFEMK